MTVKGMLILLLCWISQPSPPHHPMETQNPNSQGVPSLTSQGVTTQPGFIIHPSTRQRLRTTSTDSKAESSSNRLISNPLTSKSSNLKSPQSWRPSKGVKQQRKWKVIVLHHSATSQGSVESIHEAHLRRKWLGIGYHFVIGNGKGMPDGAIEPTFRWKQQMHGAHAGVKDFNETGIGICVIGNFENGPPSAKQIQSMQTLVSWLKRTYKIPQEKIIGHKSVKATACPGKHFPKQLFLKQKPNDSRSDVSH